MARSINKAILVGNLTRDPELKYTPQGHAVCNFGVATNRNWVADGERRESAEFHNVVAWNKLAEICDQLLGKGDQVYVEGRLNTRSWEDDDGKKNYRTEIVIDEMVLLTSRSGKGSADDNYDEVKDVDYESVSDGDEEGASEDVDAEDIPF